MSDEELKRQIEVGEKEEDIYTEEGREELVEDDAITDQEAGFVQGYEEEEKVSSCQTCGKLLTGENFVEKEIDGDIVRFCSDECAERYET